MVERAAGQHPAKPVAQPTRAKPAEKSQKLATTSNHTKGFIDSRGKDLLGAGKPPAYSNRPTREADRVSLASGLIVQNKKARHK
jgi:hypothetical protein